MATANLHATASQPISSASYSLALISNTHQCYRKQHTSNNTVPWQEEDPTGIICIKHYYYQKGVRQAQVLTVPRTHTHCTDSTVLHDEISIIAADIRHRGHQVVASTKPEAHASVASTAER